MGSVQYFFYRTAILVLKPIIVLRYWIKAKRQAAYSDRMSQRFGVLSPKLQGGSIWIHAVSVGEANAAAPLVDRLLADGAGPVLMTCVTPTGSMVIQNRFGERIQHVYAPVDIHTTVQKFLAKIQPRALIIVETELWPNLIFCSIRQSVPVIFVNMRISDRTFRKAMCVRLLCQHILKGVTAFCVQTASDAERVIALGAAPSRVHVTGNLKFDVPVVRETADIAAGLRKFWGEDRTVVILGSSHEGEEEMFIKLFGQLRNRFPRIVGIVVPRHPERFDSVFETMSRSEFSVVRRSQWNRQLTESVDLVLVDRMGELMDFYAASDVAIVGGSFVPVGGHNILEPIQAAVPVVFGPHMSNFREISKMVLSDEAGRQANDSEELFTQVEDYLMDADLRENAVRSGRKLLEKNRGSLEATCKHLNDLIAI